MQSFVGTLLHLLTSPGFVHLIDEPEAFLHPPQAMLRFTHALDAIFHESCTICEYEADCQFYSAIAEASGVTSAGPDTMYLGSGGKAGMPKLVKALAALGVPTAVIVDFDVLNDAHPLCELITHFGHDWNNIKDSWSVLKNEVVEKKKPLTKNQVAEKIESLLANEQGDSLSPEIADAIRDTLKAVSAWGEPKRLGLDYFEGGTLSKARQIMKSLATFGIYVVPVGEMEGFAREFRTAKVKGSRWVAEVLRTIKNLGTDRRLSHARDFAQSINNGFRDSATESHDMEYGSFIDSRWP